MKILNRNFLISISALFVFAATLLWYTIGFFYPGPVLIGVIAGIVAATELFVLISSARVFRSCTSRWKAVLTVLISLITFIGTGYFFGVWLLLKLAGVW